MHNLGIGSKIAGLTCLLVIVSTSAVGSYAFTRTRKAMLKEAFASLSTNAKVAGIRLLSKIDTLRQDAQFLAKIPPIQAAIQARDAGQIDPSDGQSAQDWRNRLTTAFVELARAKPHYRQISFIGVADNGLELVHVERVGDEVVAVPESDLQMKGKRDYFRLVSRICGAYPVWAKPQVDDRAPLRSLRRS